MESDYYYIIKVQNKNYSTSEKHNIFKLHLWTSSKNVKSKEKYSTIRYTKNPEHITPVMMRAMQESGITSLDDYLKITSI
jgi:hypothetical protein